MISLVQDSESLDPDICRKCILISAKIKRLLGYTELGKKYISPSLLETSIESIVLEVFRICPLVLIDVESGRLCNAPEQMRTFKSGLQFKELVSSMTEKLDDGRILRVVAKYFSM